MLRSHNALLEASSMDNPECNSSIGTLLNMARISRYDNEDKNAFDLSLCTQDPHGWLVRILQECKLVNGIAIWVMHSD